MWANRPLKPARASTARQRRERPRPTPPLSRLGWRCLRSTGSGRRLARHDPTHGPSLHQIVAYLAGSLADPGWLLKPRLAIRSTGASKVVCDSRSRRGVERGPLHIGLTALVEDAVPSFSALMIRSAIRWWSARSRAFALRAPPRCRPLSSRGRRPIRLARPATAPPMGRPVRNSSPIRLVELLPFSTRIGACTSGSLPSRSVIRAKAACSSTTYRSHAGP